MKNLKRYIIYYLHATQNEIDIDLFLYSQLGFDPEEYSNLPRPSNWKGKVSTKSPIIKNGIKILKILWNFFFYYCFITFQLFKTWYFMIITKSNRSSDINDSFYYLAFSGNYTYKLINNYRKKNSIWVIFPWNDNSVFIAKENTLKVFSLITFKDLVLSFILSILAFKKALKDKRYRKWSFSFYTSYQWFIIFFALKKLNGSFVISEHYDRWAILVDKIFFSRKKNPQMFLKSNNEELSKFIMFQHGSVTDTLKLSIRLCSLNEIYVIDELSKSIFLNFFIEKTIRNEVSVNIKPLNPIILTNNNDMLSVLFVGHPFCEELHKFLIDNLIKISTIKIYYKPHPRHLTKFINKFDKNSVVYCKDFYPKVNLVVSYPSTLAFEYESLKIPVEMHEMNFNIENSQKLLNKIKERLERINNP